MSMYLAAHSTRINLYCAVSPTVCGWPSQLFISSKAADSLHLQVQYSTLESSKERVAERKEHRNKNCVATSQVKQHGRVHDINLVGLLFVPNVKLFLLCQIKC